MPDMRAGQTDSRWVRLARELLGAASASAFDPAPVVFAREHSLGTAPIRRALHNTPGKTMHLRHPLNRNAFLAGCLACTTDERVEHLVVGFGLRHGSTTKISALRHEIGEAHSVAVPRDLRQEIDGHLATGARHEAIVFHNHPPNPLNAVLDNEPLASIADRRLLMRARYLQPLVGLKTLLGRGNLRFYLGENGYVREFTTPAIGEVLELAQRLM